MVVQIQTFMYTMFSFTVFSWRLLFVTILITMDTANLILISLFCQVKENKKVLTKFISFEALLLIF